MQRGHALTENRVQFRRARQRRQRGVAPMFPEAHIRGVVFLLTFTTEHTPFQGFVASDNAIQFSEYRLGKRKLSADGDTVQQCLDPREGEGIALQHPGIPHELGQHLVEVEADSLNRGYWDRSRHCRPVLTESKRRENFHFSGFEKRDDLRQHFVHGRRWQRI